MRNVYARSFLRPSPASYLFRGTSLPLSNRRSFVSFGKYGKTMIRAVGVDVLQRWRTSCLAECSAPSKWSTKAGCVLLPTFAGQGEVCMPATTRCDKHWHGGLLSTSYDYARSAECRKTTQQAQEPLVFVIPVRICPPHCCFIRAQWTH